MKKRTITGIFMLAIFIPLVVMKEMFILFQILMMGLSIVASNELIKMYEKNKKFPGVSKFVIMLCNILMYLASIAEWGNAIESSESTISSDILFILNINVPFISMILLVTLLLFSLLVIYKDFDGADIGKALTIIIYAGVGCASLTMLRSIGLRFILYMFLITISTDVFAYVFGSLFGKHKMCPHISPHKSWEGAIGGTAIATILGTCFAVFYGKMFANNPVFGPEGATTLLHNTVFVNVGFLARLNQVEIVFILFTISLFTSIMSQLGDLVASKLKRTYKIKDYGKIFPGHGGVLDRFDSALFAAMFIISIFSLLSILTSKLAVPAAIWFI